MESQTHDGRGGGGGGGGGGGNQRPRVSLLVRNLNFRSSPDDVRSAFGEFGPIRDVYLPLDFHTGEPRGFGFVEFESSKDAYDAMYGMHNTVLHGSTIHVTIAKKGRSDPVQMRRRELRGEFERDGPRSSHRDRFGRRWTSSRSPSAGRYRQQQRRGRSGSGSGGSMYGGAGPARAPHGRKGGDGRIIPTRGRDRSLSENDRRPRPRSSKSRRGPSPYRGRRSVSISRSRSPAYKERRPFSSDDSEEERVLVRPVRSRIEREEPYRSRGRGSHSRRRSKDRERSNSGSRRASRSRRPSSRGRTSSHRRRSSKNSRSGERAESLSQGSEEGVPVVRAAVRSNSRNGHTKECEPSDGIEVGRRSSGPDSASRRDVYEEGDHQSRGSRSRRRSSTQTSEGRRPRSPSAQPSKRRRSTSRSSPRSECGDGHSIRDGDVSEKDAGDNRHAQENAGEKMIDNDLKIESRDDTVTSVMQTNKGNSIRDSLEAEEDITPNGHTRSLEDTETVTLLTTDENIA